MPLLDEVGTYLASNGVGTVGVNLFLGYLPDLPDAAMAIYEMPGMAPVRAMRAAPGQAVAERPVLKVTARNVAFDYADARAKVGAAGALLDGLGDTTLSGTRYLWIGAVQPPFLMGRDDAGRVLVTQNFDVVKELS